MTKSDSWTIFDVTWYGDRVEVQDTRIKRVSVAVLPKEKYKNKRINIYNNVPLPVIGSD